MRNAFDSCRKRTIGQLRRVDVHSFRYSALSSPPPHTLACPKRAVLFAPIFQAAIHKEAMVGIKVDSVGSMRPKGKSYDINVFQVSG